MSKLDAQDRCVLALGLALGALDDAIEMSEELLQSEALITSSRQAELAKLRQVLADLTSEWEDTWQ